MGVNFRMGGKDELVLSSSFVHHLREQRVKLQRDLEETSKALTLVSRQLEAVATLAPHLLESAPPEQHPLPVVEEENKGEEPQAVGSPSVVEAVARAVREAGRPLLPSGIRRQIERQGDGNLIKSGNYLYTAIKRVTDRGDIVRGVDGTYRPAPPKEKSPEELPSELQS